MNNRNVNMGIGNYFENINGDVIEGKTITRNITTDNEGNIIEETTIISKTNNSVSNNRLEHHTINNTGAGGFNFGEIEGTVANVINTTSSNRVVQQSINNVGIGNLSENSTIGGNVKVAGVINEQTVQQSIRTKNSIDLTKVNEFKEKHQERIIKAEERRRKASKPHIEIEDFWTEDSKRNKEFELSSFLDLFNKEVETLIGNDTVVTYMKSCNNIVNYLEKAPNILHYVFINQNLIKEILEGGKNVNISLKLFKKVLIFLED